MNKQVLLCGNDQTLLLTREKVLRVRFPVAAVLGVSGLPEKLEAAGDSVVVLCHSLELVERQAAIDLIRRQSGCHRILVLRRTTETTEDNGIDELEGLAGPVKLIERVQAMISN